MKPEQVVEIQDLAFQAAGDYCKAKAIAKGLPKEAHAGAMVHALWELGLLVQSQNSDAAQAAAEDAETKAKTFFSLCKLENGSQLRQDLEKANILGKSSDTLLSQYCP